MKRMNEQRNDINVEITTKIEVKSKNRKHNCFSSIRLIITHFFACKNAFNQTMFRFFFSPFSFFFLLCVH